MARRRALVGIVVAGAILLAACGGGGGGGAPTAAPEITPAPELTPAPAETAPPARAAFTGDAPNFNFNLYQGEEVLGRSSLSLADLAGKPAVINFWAGLCPPCRAELPDLQGFYDEFGADVTLVSVDVGRASGLGSRDDAVELLEELNITYPAAYPEADQERQVFRDYRILSMPTTVFITAEGDIFRKWAGALTSGKVREITLEMLSAN